MNDATPIGVGIHQISAERYHRDPCERPSLSSTVAKMLIDRSPAHAFTASPRLNPDWTPTNSATFDVGRAAHEAVLGAGGGYSVYPSDILGKGGNVSTKEAKSWGEEQRAGGITPIKADVETQIFAMRDVCHKALAEMRIVLDPIASEQVAIGIIDDVWCRAMVDNAPVSEIQQFGRCLIDLKTTEKATTDACVRSITNYGYDFQARHYQETWHAATGEWRDFLFVFQEKAAPYEVTVIKLLAEPGHSADWLEVATDKVKYARNRWRQCLNDNDWPGYPRLVTEVGAPPWNAQNWEDKRGREETASAHMLAAARKFQEPERKVS
tara:strand:+ start:726 stop:1697 length:972 start_codon:yes stop_codon:yes gene_type:complete